MTGTRLTLPLVIAALGAGALALGAQANPPVANSTYNLVAGTAVIGQAVVGAGGDQQGATLAAGSYVNADCSDGQKKLFTAHVDLAGTPVSNPAGVINAAPAATKDPASSPGTLSTRFFLRWYPSTSAAPTQGTPKGGPGGPGGGQGAAGPAAGDTGSGTFSGRNSPASATSGGVCSFTLSFVAQKVA